MQIYNDKIDLYGQDGKLLKSEVSLDAISPLKNPAIAKMIFDIKRSCAVNLASIEKGLRTGAMGGKSVFIPGRELDLPIVENAELIADKINGALSVDVADTQIQLLINGTGGNEWTITKY